MNQFLRHYSNKLLWLGLGSFFILTGCGSPQQPTKNDIIARYRQEYLSREEVDHFTPSGLSSEDSVRFAKQYIQEWVRHQAIAERARLEIPDLADRVSFKVRDYEAELINQEFARWLVEERPETFVVSESDIRNYYQRYPEKFVSQNTYYQYFYVRTEANANAKVGSLMRSNDQNKQQELLDWAKENAVEYRLDSSYVDDVELERITTGFYYGNPRRVSKSLVYPYQATVEEVGYYNYYRLINIIEEGDLLPLRICREKIRNIILNQRRNSTIEQMQDNLVQQARSAEKYVIYE
ncbi:MAG: hypothetical protein AAF206_26890 [Bacteroidota bacterium]